MNKFMYYFKKRWYLFVLILLVCIPVFSVSVNKLTEPKETERVNIFIASNSASGTNLRTKLKENKPSYLKEIDVYSVLENDSNFSELLVTRGLLMSDMFILPSDTILEKDHSSFMELDVEYIKSGTNYDFEYVVLDEKILAIKIYNSETKEGLLKNYINYSDKDYYLMISVNTKQMDSNTEGIIYILNKFIELSE